MIHAYTLSQYLIVVDHPSSPAILSLDPITPGQLSLTWSQPYSPPTVLLSYIVTITQMDPNGGSFGQPLSVVVENSTTYIFTPAVQSCNEYSFTVQAENLAGTSEYSEAVSETLPVGEFLLQFNRLEVSEELSIIFLILHSSKCDPTILQSHSYSGC